MCYAIANKMELLKSSTSVGFLFSNEIKLFSAPRRIPTNTVHGYRHYFRESDDDRILGGVLRHRVMQCLDPVTAEKYIEQGENGGLKVVKSCNGQTQVDTNLSSAWFPQQKNPDRMVDEEELLMKEFHFVSSASRTKFASWVCFAKGPRPRKPRVWKSRTRIGTVSKAQKLVEHVKALSNVKEEVYGALDAFIAWEVEFPLIMIKKALKTFEAEKEWKRIIQITKWMLRKGQGKTMGNYYLLLNALAEEQRIEEAEELWLQIFNRHLEYVPRMFFTRVIKMYERNNLTDKLLEVFADMEELGVKPDHSAITVVANTFKNLGMMDKYEKVSKKYPEIKWEYHIHKGYRYRVIVQPLQKSGEDMIQHNENNSNVVEEDISAKDQFPTAEGTAQQNEVSESLDKDPTRVAVSI